MTDLERGFLAAQIDQLKILAESRGMGPGHKIHGTLHAARCELRSPSPNMGYIRAILKMVIPDAERQGRG